MSNWSLLMGDLFDVGHFSELNPKVTNLHEHYILNVLFAGFCNFLLQLLHFFSATACPEFLKDLLDLRTTRPRTASATTLVILYHTPTSFLQHDSLVKVCNCPDKRGFTFEIGAKFASV